MRLLARASDTCGGWPVIRVSPRGDTGGTVEKEAAMTGGQTWTRRNLIQGLMVLAWPLPLAGSRDGWAAGTEHSVPPRDREARRRWALARMDEMAQERLRCRDRFKVPHQIRECEADFERRHRAYNEIYIEAARE